MAKKPEDRPQTYEELLAELAAVRHALLAPQPVAAEAAEFAPTQALSAVTVAENKSTAPARKLPALALLVSGAVLVGLLTLGLFLWAPWKPGAASKAEALETKTIRLWDTP